MFLDYKKGSKDLVLDLINRDNPDLEYPLDHENCILGIPIVLSAAESVEFRNTVITVTYVGEPADKYLGPVRLYYRRLTGKELFPGGNVIFDHYRASGNISKEEYIDQINFKYGLALTDADISTGAISNSNTTGNISLASDCLAFVGNFAYSRIQPLIPIDVKVPSLLEDWLVVQPEGEYDYTPVLHGVDFTPFDHLIVGAGNTFQNSQYSAPLIEVMKSYSNIEFGHGTDRPLDAANIRATVYVGYSEAIPMMNTEYSRVMVIAPANANSWLKGSIYLHFDKDL